MGDRELRRAVGVDRRAPGAQDALLIPLGDLTVELDVYEGDLDGLVTAEVEFPDEASALAFDAPEWLGRDVTEDKRYGNRVLAVEGLPT